MLTRLGQFTVRRRRLVLSLTVLFMIVAGVLGTGAFGVLQDEGFVDPSSESADAARLLETHFDDAEPNVLLVVTATDGTVDGGAVAAASAQLIDEVRQVEHVAGASSYWELGGPSALRSDDARRALMPIVVEADGEDEAASIEALREIAERAPPAIEVAVGGPDAVGVDIGTTIESDLVRAETIAIPVTLLLLLFVFGGLVAASLPLLVGVVAVLGTFLTLFVVGSITDVSIYAVNLTTALGLGLAIDYSLFIVSRYREELRAGRSVDEAVVRSVETAGRTVLISALTVAVSLGALFVFPLYFLRSFAYAGIAVVLLAMVASIVTLPALLAVVGTRIDRLRVFPVRATRPPQEGFWYRTTRRVMRRPIIVSTAVVAILILLGLPFLNARFASPDDRVLPESAPSRVANDQLREDFAGNDAESFPIVLTGADATGDGVAGDEVDGDEVDAYALVVSSIDGVARVDGPAGTYVAGALAAPNGDPTGFAGDGVVRLTVVPSIEMVSSEGESLIAEVRDLPTGFETAVGGQTAEFMDTRSAIGDRLPWAIGFIVIATAVLLFLLSGSVLIPIKALLLNVLSLTATFGAMVWIFQEGNLAGLFGVTATGAIDTAMPILMFCIAFGLSMDYEVFVLSRIKEEHDRTGDNDEAVAMGLERTGRIVTAAAAVLSVTFFAFATSGVSFIVMFGLGLGIAVLMDAFVIRGTLVPAFMKLAGEANWWAPGPLRRFHDRFGISESDERDDTPRPSVESAPDLVDAGSGAAR